MKKIIGIATLTVLLWLGATAYIGSNVEPKLNEFLKSLNVAGKSSGVEYSAKIIEKSFFSTKFEIDIDASGQDKNDSARKLPILIDNGPIFFGKNFGFGLIDAHHDFLLKRDLIVVIPELGTGEFIKEEDVEIIAYATVGFGKNLKTNITVEPFTIVDGDGTVVAKVGKISLKSNSDIKTMLGTGHIKIPALTLRNEPNRDIDSVELLDIDFSWNSTDKIREHITLGKVSLSISEMRLLQSGKEKTVIAPTMILDISKESNETLEATIQMAYDHLRGDFIAPGTPIINANIKYKMGGLGVTGLEHLTTMGQKIEQQQAKVLATLEEKANDSEALANAMTKMDAGMPNSQEIIALLKEIMIKDKTYIELTTLMSTKESKDNSLHTKVLLVQDLPNSIQDLQDRLQSKSLLLEMTSVFIDLSVQEKFVRAVDQSGRGIGVLENALTEGYLIKNGTRYAGKIEYDKNKLNLNGKDSPQILMMLKMMLDI